MVREFGAAVEREFGAVSPEVFAAAVSLLTDGVCLVSDPDGTMASATSQTGLYDENSNTIYVDSPAWNDYEAAGRRSANVSTLSHEALDAMIDFTGLTAAAD